MAATDQVQVQVLRWTEETVTIKDLLMWQIIEIRLYHDDEYDIYYPIDTKGQLRRVGTMKGLTDADVDLFYKDSSKFWDKHADKVTDLILGQICKIPNYNFRCLS